MPRTRRQSLLKRLGYAHANIRWTDLEVDLPQALLAWWGDENSRAGVFHCDVLALLPGAMVLVWCEKDSSFVRCAQEYLFHRDEHAAALRKLPRRRKG
jgi:hypothetical protein